MNIEITARHFTPSADLKAFVNDKVSKLLKYDPKINLVRVVLLKESRAEKVELIVNSKNKQYITNCYSSVFEKTILNGLQNTDNSILLSRFSLIEE